MARILIIDDDNEICNLLQKQFTREGHETSSATSGKKALTLLKETEIDVVFCDYRLTDTNGRDLLIAIKSLNPEIKVIIITGYSDVKIAVEVIKCGAFEFITKPLLAEEIRLALNKALAEKPTGKSQVNEEIVAVPFKTSASVYSEKLVEGQCEQARKIQTQIALVAPTNYSVIIYGESGTGKESIAFNIHKQSARRDKPFIAVDCGALTKELSGSELFGHEKGSFTGALQTKIGQFELANGGTIFLDEIANLGYEIQVSLLRVIQERKIRRIGSQKEIDIDVRIIVASNERLNTATANGKFREDLYHRFNEFEIQLPPLRERKEDILQFTDFFIKKTNLELNKHITKLSENVERIFMEYKWPGNLREMNNVIKRACLMSEGTEITSEALPPELIRRFMNPGGTGERNGSPEEQANSGYRPDFDLKSVSLKAEYDRIVQVLRSVSFNKSKAARILNVDRKTLYNKLNYFNSLLKPIEPDASCEKLSIFKAE